MSVTDDNTTRLNEDRCLCCGKPVDAATAASGEGVRPNEDDLSVCIYCGHVMAFDKDLRLRELTASELAAASKDKRLLNAIAACAEYRRRYIVGDGQ